MQAPTPRAGTDGRAGRRERGAAPGPDSRLRGGGEQRVSRRILQPDG